MGLRSVGVVLLGIGVVLLARSYFDQIQQYQTYSAVSLCLLVYVGTQFGVFGAVWSLVSVDDQQAHPRMALDLITLCILLGVATGYSAYLSKTTRPHTSERSLSIGKPRHCLGVAR